MSNSVAPLRTERNFKLIVLAGHFDLMVEIGLTVSACRHLLVIHLALFLVHLGLILGRDLATSLVDLTASLVDLTASLVDLTASLMGLTIILMYLTVVLVNLAVVLTDLSVIPMGSGTVVLLDSGLTGTTGAGTNLSIELVIIESSRHRYREDKS